MDRAKGFYWVKQYDRWIVGYYDAGLKRWELSRNPSTFPDADFDEIGPPVIHPEDDAKTIFAKLTEEQVTAVISRSQPGDPVDYEQPDLRPRRVVLVGYDRVIETIRVIRSLRPELGLAQAKAITDAVNRGSKATVIEYLDTEFEAERAVKLLREVGAHTEVEII